MGSHKQKQGKGKNPLLGSLCVSQDCGHFPRGLENGAEPWTTFSSDASLPVCPSKLSMLLSLAHFSRVPKGWSTGHCAGGPCSSASTDSCSQSSTAGSPAESRRCKQRGPLAFPYLQNVSEFVWIMPWFLQPVFLSRVLAFLPKLEKEGAMWLLPPGEVALHFGLP